jgi:hypothetical protein
MPLPSPFGPQDDNVIIETGGLTFFVATDSVVFAGVTAQFQLQKLAFGPTGSAQIVDSSNGLPVNVIGGGITANLVGFCGAVQGIIGGTPVTVDGTVYVTGISSAPAYVRTASGYQVEITGGVPLNKTKDAISVFGPSGSTWIFANLVNTSGNAIGTTANPIYANIIGATISATINPIVGVTNSAASPLFVCGVSGATGVNVNVQNTVVIDDSSILTGMTAIYGQVVTLNSNLSTLGLAKPASLKTGRVTSTFSTTQQLDSGFTCQAGVNIKALSTNTDFVYVGNTSASATLISSGYAMDPGDETFVDINNLSKIYIVAASGTQSVTFLAS